MTDPAAQTGGKRPNILILMVDQLNGTLFPDGPADWLHAPNLRKLAERSTRFANTYTGSPLCAPGRASYMSGQLPRRTKVYDNAAEFASDIPTYAHHLRRAGYQTFLSGKMHFVGPDQLHGFEKRLTTDIYPADFGWTPDYRKPGERIDWWYHNMGSVTGAGVAEISNQMEYDDEVAFQATAKVRHLGRRLDDRPWMMTVSFTHPHDPYVARKKYWDLYEDCEHLLPEVPAKPYEEMDPHSQRIFDANDWRNFDISEEDVKRSRRAYFANISYLDDKIGEILEALDNTRQTEETIVMLVSDHGDMLGNKGLWFKMTFFEGSARVPLMVAAPQMAPGLVETPVSTIDVNPTLAELAWHRHFRNCPLDRWRKRGGPGQWHRTYLASADGICRRRLLRAAGRPAHGRLEIHPVRAGSAAALQPGGGPERVGEPRRRPRLAKRGRAICEGWRMTIGIWTASTPRCAKARPAA